MRLHRVRLCNYRGVADCEVELPAQGITVIEGPNEVGKTSMLEGLDLVLTKMDSSGRRQVKSAQPVGRDVGPEVEIEMSTGQYRFIYRKRWLRRSETVLNVLTPQPEQLTGRAAHERVDEILAETLDGDLWEALWIEQGAELWLPGFDVPSLVAALDTAATGQDAADEDDDLWSRICEEHERYWTATGRPKRDRTARQAEVEGAQSEVSELTDQIDSIDRDAAEADRLARDKGRLEVALAQYRKQASDLSEQWYETEQVRNRVDYLTSANEAATLRRDSIASEQQRRRELVDELSSRAEKLEELDARALQSAPALAAAISHVEQTAAALEAAQTALSVAESEQRRANEDRDHLRNRIEVEQLSERHERIVEAEQKLRKADNVLESIKIDEGLLAQVEQAHLAVVSAEAAIASVETTALRDLSIEVNDEEVALAAGEARHTVVDEDVMLVIRNTAEIRVRAGTGSQSLAIQRRHVHQEFRRLCEAAGVADQPEARRAAQERKDAARHRQEALDTIARDLRDLTVDRLQGKIEGLTKRVNAYTAERPDDPPLPPDFETAKQVAAGKARTVDEKREEFDKCNQAATSASDALQQERVDESSLATMIKMAREAKAQAADALESARSARSDSAITSELAQAEKGACAALESLDEAETELSAADPKSLKARLRNAQDATQRASEDLRANEDRQQELRISLSVRGEGGLHTRHAEALVHLRHLEREHQRTEARAEAARLLHDTFSRRRQESRQRYRGPFKERIEELGRIVFNSSFSVEIDGDLSVARRTLDGDTLEVDQLSTGAREQIGVLCRLACAAMVSPDGGGAPVIIDDALGWSDPDRLERMGAAIASAGQRCQVIILTCTPGRYAHIGNATTVRLPSDE
ncbi:MAG: AAA family ATPase [Acidimicrobiaceae bacterium]|nr:AAA family ATPase [Acidimicrobiaceae bacterium]